MLKVIKKDGTVEPWDGEKIKTAVRKAAERANFDITEEELDDVVDRCMDFYSDSMKTVDEVPTSELHRVVIWSLEWLPLVQKAYKEYRDYKNTYARAFENVKKEADTVLLLGDRENANFDSSLISTKGSLIKGYLTKELYKQFYLSENEKQATKTGFYYIHDLRDMIFGSVNCCLFDMATVLKDGFEMSNVKYTEPQSVLSALQVIGDITLVATAQQFGGFSVVQIDKTLLPYALRTYGREYEYAATVLGLSIENSHKHAQRVLERELEQGFQSLELKLNTVPCSRGDFAFTTLTFGEWSNDTSSLEQEFMSLICKKILETRMKGHGDKQVVFPKLVYTYSKEQHKDNPWHKEVFDLAIECSSKCMYPDYLSIDSDYGSVSKTFKESGCIIHPMGKRQLLPI